MNERIKELVCTLNYHTLLYDQGIPTISDAEWDKMYFELQELEKQTGIILPNSPTQSISYEVKSELEKVTHDHPLLSLAKTKNWEEFKSYFASKEYALMLKLDGLTCSLRYENGFLVKAETRGNGIVGENILHNAKVIKNIPKTILYNETLVVDGEIICKDDDFAEFSTDYANSRNYASGSIRLLDSEECSKRKLSFIAWNVAEGFDDENSFYQKMINIKDLGFEVTPIEINTKSPDCLKQKAKECGYPIDGLVGRFNDIAYGEKLGSTDHHSKAAFAFKFYDEVYETELLDIEWSAGRTGVFTPVAIFSPVEIDGTIVERASLHNVSILREILGLPYKGQIIQVAKMNMIIPQVLSAVKVNSPNSEIYIPEICPICGEALKILQPINSDTLSLVCVNKQCHAKLLNRLDHFCGKKGLDIKGLSVATLDKLIEKGWINSLVDLFTLNTHRAEWCRVDGFGPKSVDKVLAAIEAAKETTLDKFIAALGIPLIGSTVAKDLVTHIKSYDELRDKVNNCFNFCIYDGFADSKSAALLNFDYTEADEIIKYLSIGEVEEKKVGNNLDGVNVAITGSLKLFKNRAELVSAIENAGGKINSSVTSKTNYLVNNDNTSNSSKNLSAQKLSIPILTEQEFVEKFLKN